MALPKVFVIGDSISCYYGTHLERMLAGVFAYDRKGGTHKLADLKDGTDGVNGGDSAMVLTYVRELRKRGGFHADWVLLNCGLHDTKTDLAAGVKQVPAAAYERNLREVCGLLRAMGARVVWVRTTPIRDLAPEAIPADLKPCRYNADVVAYNAIADRVMADLGIPSLDLYTFTLNLGPDVYFDKHVHFDETAAAKQAAFIAGGLDALVPRAAQR